MIPRPLITLLTSVARLFSARARSRNTEHAPPVTKLVINKETGARSIIIIATPIPIKSTNSKALTTAVRLANSRANFTSRLLVNALILVTTWSITLLRERSLTQDNGRRLTSLNVLSWTLWITPHATWPPYTPTTYRVVVATLTITVFLPVTVRTFGKLIPFPLRTRLTVCLARTGKHSASVIAIAVSIIDRTSTGTQRPRQRTIPPSAVTRLATPPRPDTLRILASL